MKLINAIGGDIGRAPELVWRHSLRKFLVDPENCIRRIQRTFDICDAHLISLKIVGETARAGAFVTGHMNVLARKCAIGEMNSGVGAVHPCAAEAAAPEGNGSLAVPILWIAICATDFEPDCRRTLPLPFPQKFI